MTLAGNPLIVEWSTLGRLEHLADGGTARVHRCPDLQLPGLPALVFKEYKLKTRRVAGPSLLPGLLSLAQFRDHLTDKQRDGWDRKLIWPLRVVVEGNAAIGILMKLIPNEFFITVSTTTGAMKTKPTEIDMVLGADMDAARFNFPQPSLQSRLTLCSQIVSTYALVHQRGLIVGDVSARNLVFNDGPLGPRTLLVDCDSFRVAGKRAAFGNQPHTGSWEPPEALEAAARLRALRRTPDPSLSEIARLGAMSMTQSKSTDVYKIGLLVVRVLDHGRQKSRNRNPEVALKIIEQQMSRARADVLRAALDPDPKGRPELIEWHKIWHDKPLASSAPQQPSKPSVIPGVRAAAGANGRSGASPNAGVNGSNDASSIAPPRPISPTSVPAPTGPPQGHRVSGNWEWVDRKGWTRRNPGATVAQP